MSYADDLALLRSLPRAYDPDDAGVNVAGERLRILGFAYLDETPDHPSRWCRTALGSTTLAWMDDTDPNLNAVRECPCCKGVHRVEVDAPAPAAWRAADIARLVAESNDMRGQIDAAIDAYVKGADALTMRSILVRTKR